MKEFPIRIQLSRKKGWRMPPETVKVDRSTKWGNPFVKHDAGIAVASFRSLLRQTGAWWPIPTSKWPKGKIPAVGMTTVDDVKVELRGKNLACWCALDKPCHVDVLLDVANR